MIVLGFSLTKQRLDSLLVSLKLCESRSLAQRMIRAGQVRVKDQVIDKPGAEVDSDADIKLQQKPKYVSRGGDKLAKALAVFPITVKDRICLDGGISTGGFTDCLLQFGAKKVYGIDVGYGQVAWSLRQDQRVILKERTNFRYLTYSDLYGEEQTPADLGVMDLSFISLTKVLQTLWNLLKGDRDVILLVKPQFEVGRDRVGKKGVVRSPKDHGQAIFKVWQFAQDLGWQYGGLTWSPITGPAGNIEYLLWLNTKKNNLPLTLEIIQEITEKATPNL
jgi:23S rRNA (cytidine1920-2'-O)/16S rRNA (cytidine1409-2'-O)-methyltransferase